MYLSGFEYSSQSARLIYRAILWAAGSERLADDLLPDDPACECAYYPQSQKLVLINNETRPVSVRVKTPFGEIKRRIAAESIEIASAKSQAP